VTTPIGDLRVRGLSKHFAGVTALDGADLRIEFGKVTALVGDNGAGKSTLVKILSGVMGPDEGEIRVKGELVSFDSPNVAIAWGVHTVYQDLALADNLDVVENLFLGSELRTQLMDVRLPILNRREMERQAHELLTQIGITNIGRLTQRIETLSGGQRQTIAIARALRERASVVILDEPTAALGVKQSAQVQKAIRKLREVGTGVLIVSHNLQEVFRVADAIAVMRLGKVVDVFDARDCREEEVVAAIVGTRSRGAVVA
jgi:D-xylose transport system ATP-binding protein